MGSKLFSCGEIGINKNAFHKATISISIDAIEINRIMLFEKSPYGNKGLFKHYIEYRHKGEAFPSPLKIKLPQLTGYTKHFDANDKFINFFSY